MNAFFVLDKIMKSILIWVKPLPPTPKSNHHYGDDDNDNDNDGYDPVTAHGYPSGDPRHDMFLK